ncbi:TRAP-type mannitol/chloroaromatic compound transport system, small permease component [Rhodovulum sp. ES.010]|uniref:TRAP transporter small permease subunit n=1 Tax=Rhodovulum sp. ES.010 TaxID=1882821 RepID=UPI00092B81D8|nr:TRAP transporter small permease subunit [Rhodovulum sp. ES.010]SIO02447.1 TRAP-type mannitol/chloroaromatic compound transport system, small permease component [Rhodovulum sp. ES.010]
MQTRRALSAYLALCRWLDRAALALCILAGLFLTGAVLAIVVLRYGFGAGFIELQDAAAYAFAVLMAFSLPVTLARNGHVRVEVVSERLPPGYLRAADALALVLFLVPVFGLLIRAFLPDLAYAWSIREGSVETGGLGGLYLVKTALPVAAALMILQGVAQVLGRRTAE